MLAGVSLLGVPGWCSAQDPNAAPPTSLPASLPAPDLRPRVAVTGMTPDPQGDERDAWIAVAVEEVLTWRLRRVPTVVALPTIRLFQGRLEMQEPNGPPPPWPLVIRGLGATHVISGRCRGTPTDVALELQIARTDNLDAPLGRHTCPTGRLFDVLDDATRWVLGEFKVTELNEKLAARIFAPPSTSLSAVEYFARATTAARQEDPRKALRWATEAVDSDRRYRPAIGLLAQLEVRGGERGRDSAATRLRMLSDMARMDGDTPDRVNAELALSLIMQASGSSEAARTRAETALELAVAEGDTYGQVAALAWIADLCLTWQTPAGPKAPPEKQKELQRENLLRAAQWQSRLLDVLAGLGDVVGSLPATSKLALIYERLDDVSGALEMHERTLKMAQNLGSRPHQATAYIYLGQCYARQKRWPEALAAMHKCLELADESVHAEVRIALANVYQGMEDHAQALQELERAYAAVKKDGDMNKQFLCLREMAREQRKLGQTKEAVASMQRAIDIAHALELTDEEALRTEMKDWQ